MAVPEQGGERRGNSDADPESGMMKFEEEGAQHRERRASRRRTAAAVVICASFLAVCLLAASSRSSISSPGAMEVASFDVGVASRRNAHIENQFGEMEKREDAQTEDHSAGIDAALQLHRELSVHAAVRVRLAARRAPQQKLSRSQQLAADGDAQPQGDIPAPADTTASGTTVHFWDLINPTGESAKPPDAATRDTASPQMAVAEEVMGGGGIVDPEAVSDLNKGLAEHEAENKREEQEVAAGSAQNIPMPREVQWGGMPAVEPESHGNPKMAAGNQGFVTGSLLRVSAAEYHQRMHNYMPSADGHLISPFDWFQSMGRHAPKAAQKGAAAGEGHQ